VAGALAVVLLAATMPAQENGSTGAPSGIPSGNQSGSQSNAMGMDTLATRIDRIMSRPEFKFTSFGIEFYSLDKGRPVYELNAGKLFTPGSTTKLLTEGTVLALLGADYRFHTRVYRTGPIDSAGNLKGDLVLVASGDPNLSGRIEPDGTMDFENEDHAYAGSPDTKAVPGDPLAVIREMAAQVFNKGVRQVEGHVFVDASLFREGARELGTQTVISPICVNDNIVDVTLTPGARAGSPVTAKISPITSYATFTNQAQTGAADSRAMVRFGEDVEAADGTHALTIAGSMPAGGPSILYAYKVPEPTRYAEIVFTEALREKGVTAQPRPVVPASANPNPNPNRNPNGNANPNANANGVDLPGMKASYTDDNVVAEHVSPPLAEEVKVTLKVSQNLHASMTPSIVGALVGKRPGFAAEQAGFDAEKDFLTKAGLDLGGASQADGAGGAPSAYFTPDFIVHYLEYWSKRPDFNVFYNALPILGKDGTLWNIQPDSPAAGKVHAKTGTFSAGNALTRTLIVTGKGLGGYMTTASGQHLAFAIYANHVTIPRDLEDGATKIVGQAVGEIAAAAYDAPGLGEEMYDILIRNGKIVDGSGNPWFKGDVAIRGNRIAAVGKLGDAHAGRVIDAKGMVVAPGFIDMLGQSEMSLLIDNRAQSKLSQGITTEITGEGGSAAPQNEKTLAPLQPFLDHFHLKVDWTDLAGYMRRLEKDGTAINLGTYVGAAQVREYVLGDADRAPTPEELAQMQAIVAKAMEQGAMGLSTALIYPPGHYAKTEELIALAKVAGRYGGIYATHMRSEGRTEMAAIDEAIQIGREGGLPVEIFHMKVAGKDRWGQMSLVVKKIEDARKSGVEIAADMYPYLAGATALASALPPWVADGGTAKLLERLHDPTVRQRIRTEMAVSHKDWENLYLASGGPAGVMIASVFKPELKKFEGKTVAEMASTRQKQPIDALMDFVIEDNAQTSALYFIASEPDLQTGLKQSWTSIGLDAGEESLDGPLYGPHDHPRTWGSMPRFLGHYSRDLKLVPLEQAVRKITSLPAEREHLAERGFLKPGYFADVTIFDPDKIIDHATYTQPGQVSEGVSYVVVNGQVAYENGKVTGVKAGVPLHGPGWKPDPSHANAGMN
jgi:dihydroorotase/N-acyl-D-amino-acid deacylase